MLTRDSTLKYTSLILEFFILTLEYIESSKIKTSCKGKYLKTVLKIGYFKALKYTYIKIMLRYFSSKIPLLEKRRSISLITKF